MAADDPREDDWGDKTAGLTFWGTIILAILYVGTVFFFILPH